MTEPAAQPDDLTGAFTPEPSMGQAELTAEEARDLATELGIDLYRAQDALAFVGECCDIAEREQKPITVGDVREWLKGARCGRQLAVEQPATLTALAAQIEVRDPCPHCESSPDLIPRHRMAAHIAETHPEVRTGGPGTPVADAEPECGPAAAPTPSRRAGLCREIAKAIHRYDYDHLLSGNDIPSKHHRGEADAVLALLYREWPWLQAEAEDGEQQLARVRALIAEYPVAVGTHLLEEALDQPKEQR